MEISNWNEKDCLYIWLSLKWIHQLLLCSMNRENVESFEGSISPVCLSFYILPAVLLVITATLFVFFCAAGKKKMSSLQSLVRSEVAISHIL